MSRATTADPGGESGRLGRAFFAELAAVLPSLDPEAFAAAAELLLEAALAGRRVYALGNGGSATTATHLVCDLVKTASVPGRPVLRAEALADNAALLTAWANDAAYERVFSEQLAAAVEPRDVVVAISVSGRSPNVVAALRTAAERGASTILLTAAGSDGTHELADVVIAVPSDDYGVVETAHVAVAHALTRALASGLLAAADGSAAAAAPASGHQDGL